MESPDPSGSRTLFVSRIPHQVSESELLELFKDFGEILSIHMPASTVDLHLGYCFVTFSDPTDAQEAKQNLDGYTLHGTSLIVKSSKEKE